VTSAYADESFHEAPSGGFYVLAAAVFDGDDHELSRETMLQLRAKEGRGKVPKLHWHNMNRHRRLDTVTRIAELGGFHVVTIGAPVPHRRQERARAACLTRLVHELHGCDVHTLFMESRTRVLNLRDVRTVSWARRLLPKSDDFQVEHLPGGTEPLLWVADVIAGAVRAHREGEPAYRQLLDDRLYEIAVDTNC
jgi:Protein of unknown function (DUF3800)